MAICTYVSVNDSGDIHTYIRANTRLIQLDDICTFVSANIVRVVRTYVSGNIMSHWKSAVHILT